MKRDLENFFTGHELRCWARTAPLEDDVYEHMARHYNKILREYVKENGKKIWLCIGELKTAHLAEPVDATHTAILLDEKEIKGDE